MKKTKTDGPELIPAEAAPAEPPTALAEKLTVEQWAERKGMLPQFPRSSATAFGLARPNPEYWKFAAVKAFKRWDDGVLLSEQEFDAAVAEMTSQRIG